MINKAKWTYPKKKQTNKAKWKQTNLIKKVFQGFKIPPAVSKKTKQKAKWYPRIDFKPLGKLD